MTGRRPDQPLIAAQDPGDGQGRPADHMLPVTSSDTEPASEWLQLIGYGLHLPDPPVFDVPCPPFV